MSLSSRGRAIIAIVQNNSVGRLIWRYGEDRADLLAASVAFNALFSMFPIILGVLGIVGLIIQSPDSQDRAQALVLSVVPAEGTASVIQTIESASQSAGLFGLLGLAGLLLSGFSLFDALEIAFNRVYRVPPHSFVRQKLIAVGMVLLFAVLVLAMMAASAITHLVGRFAQNWAMVEPGVVPTVAVAGGVTSLLAAFALCFVIFYVVPNVRLKARQVLPGTVFASLALFLLTQAFPIYALYIGDLNQYGAIFGLFFLLMTWAYLVAQALMVGVELNALFHPAVSEKRKEPEPA